MNDVVLCLTCSVLLLWVVYLKRRVDALTEELAFVKNPKLGASKVLRQHDAPGMKTFDVS